MIRPSYFINQLRKYSIDFFVGVPDSLLKNICAYLLKNIDKNRNIIAANEGGALSMAAGYYLATKNIPVVYMQNSGLGNVVNPLLSLIDPDVYNIPALLVIGWRGEPGIKDEPQHVSQGRLTLPLLEVLGVEYCILSDESDFDNQLDIAIKFMNNTNKPYAFIIRKGIFESEVTMAEVSYTNDTTIVREDAIKQIIDNVEDNAIIVSTTGMISRELFEVREAKGQGHERDFLTVGSMGHASQIALGIALQKTERPVYCIDGDGAALMHMGSMTIIGSCQPLNYTHIVLNNGAHDSVGGQPTVCLTIELPSIAKACGYKEVVSVNDSLSLAKLLSSMKVKSRPMFLEIKVKKGARKDLGRPTTTPIQNRDAFMNYIEKSDE